MARTKEQIQEMPTATERSASHWESVAKDSPADVAFHCRDYAKHLRTIAECLRMDTLEKDIFNEGETPCKNFG
jgi:hypothetical protein